MAADGPRNPWLLPKRGLVTHASAVKLFCFPQAGMGAWAYQAWADKLAPDVQVLPVELPGHGARMREPRQTDACQLAKLVVDALASHFQSGPYALFGHSLGAWIVWEVLQELTRRGLPPPMRAYVSGNRAACLHGADNDPDATRLHQQTGEAFWAAFEQRYGSNQFLQDPKIREHMYPLLHDDFTMAETYQPSAPDVPTAVPLTAVGARLDNRYKPEQIAAWQQHASGEFEELWLEGLGHNFVGDAPQQLMDALRRQLAPQPAAAAAQP